MKTPEGFCCTTCKKEHRYTAYVYAHMDEVLSHKCNSCGAEHSIYQGNATIQTPGKQGDGPPADRFRVGDTWNNSRGTPHTVVGVVGKTAHLVNQHTSRTGNRAVTDLGPENRRWVRTSCASATS